MKLRLKEEPREWRKFTLSTAVVLAILGGYARWRALLSISGLVTLLGVLALLLAACLVWPRWFRGPYRAGMIVSYHLGRIMGPIALTVLFFLVLTPWGLVLRLLGKDLLRLKRDPAAATYWRPAKPSADLERMF